MMFVYVIKKCHHMLPHVITYFILMENIVVVKKKTKMLNRTKNLGIVKIVFYKICTQLFKVFVHHFPTHCY